MRTISPLARHIELVPLLASWFVEEWPEWYGQGCRGNALANLTEFAASQPTLPIGFIAFDDARPVGVAALKSESLPRMATCVHGLPLASSYRLIAAEASGQSFSACWSSRLVRWVTIGCIVARPRQPRCCAVAAGRSWRWSNMKVSRSSFSERDSESSRVGACRPIATLRLLPAVRRFTSRLPLHASVGLVRSHVQGGSTDITF